MKFKFWKFKELIGVSFFLIILVGIFYAPLLTLRNFLWEDLLFYSYPSANYLAEAFREGHFPLWISGMRDGVPFYTNLNLMAFYPPLWLLALVAPGGQVTVSLYQVFLVTQFLAAGAFIWLLLREYGVHPLAALTGMVVFVFSGFFSLHIIHANVITAFLWLPLQCLFVKRIVDSPVRWGSYAGFLLATLFSFFAGFPQVVMYDSYFVLGYWVFAYIQKETAKGGVRLGLLVFGTAKQLCVAGFLFLLVVMLGAAQFVPVAENWYLSCRQAIGFDIVADMSMPWSRLILGLAPNFFGASYGDGSGVPFWGYNRDSMEFRNWHAGYWMYWDFGFYAGQIVLIALAVALFNYRKFFRERRDFIFFLAAMPVVLILMTGRYGKLFDLLYHVAPGFSMFRSPSRVGCLFELCAAVLAAGFVDILLRKKNEFNLKRPFVALGLGYIAMYFGILISGVTIFPELSDVRLMDHALGQMGQSIVFFVGTAVLLLGLRKISQKWPQSEASEWLSLSNWRVLCLAGCLAIWAFIDLYLPFHHVQMGKMNPDEYYADKNGLITQMTSLREQQGPFRFAQLRDGKLSEEIVFPRNMGYMQPNYEALEGYILFILKEYDSFCSVTNERARLDIQNVGVIANLDSRTRKVGLSRYTNSLPRAKFYHVLRAYPDSKAIYADLDSGRLNYKDTVGILSADYSKYNVPTSEPPATATAEVRFSPKTPEEYQISYRTTAPGIIFVSESFYPGWEANGRKYPIIRAFGAFKGIVISEAGSGVITVKFSPWTFKVGLAISLTTLVGLVLAYVIVRRRGKSVGRGQ